MTSFYPFVCLFVSVVVQNLNFFFFFLLWIYSQDLTEIQERTLTRRDSVNSRGGESRASSSSSSGCLSDGASCVEQGFECDFPNGK